MYIYKLNGKCRSVSVCASSSAEVHIFHSNFF